MLVALPILGIILLITLNETAKQVADDLLHKGSSLIRFSTGTESGEVFWCPMHPEIKRNQEGICPL